MRSTWAEVRGAKCEVGSGKDEPALNVAPRTCALSLLLAVLAGLWCAGTQAQSNPQERRPLQVAHATLPVSLSQASDVVNFIELAARAQANSAGGKGKEQGKTSRKTHHRFSSPAAYGGVSSITATLQWRTNHFRVSMVHL